MDNYINLWLIEIPTGNDIAKTIASEIETLTAKVAIEFGLSENSILPRLFKIWCESI